MSSRSAAADVTELDALLESAGKHGFMVHMSTGANAPERNAVAALRQCPS